MQFNFAINKISTDDYAIIENLAKLNGGNKHLNPAYIHHWYNENPSGSNSMFKVVVADTMEGYATTNNFYYTINKEKKLVAMPQNLLTSTKIRGKGIFAELYKKTENFNLNENAVECFIVFSNELSTPIFLQKFEYKRAQCPKVYFTLFNPLKIFKPVTFKVLKKLSEIDFGLIVNYDNSMIKSAAYYHWRYSNYPPNTIQILSFKKNDIQLGFAILKRQKKNGIPFLVVMDLILKNEHQYDEVIEQCSRYASKHFYAGILMFEHPASNNKNQLTITFNNRFNLLVKGKTPEITNALSQIKYNFLFGDLDIL